MEMKAMLKLADREFESRLILGTGKYSSGDELKQVCLASGAEIATMAIRKIDIRNHSDEILRPLTEIGVQLLPNTSGTKTAREAVLAAQLARETLDIDWIKVDVRSDAALFGPDPLETYEASRQLVREGFRVFACTGADPALAGRLEDLGVTALMPMAAPAGSCRGLEFLGMLQMIISRSHVPVIIDAGIGSPADLVKAFECGADACLVNTAIAGSANPVLMAKAFRMAQNAGRLAFEAGLSSLMAST